MRKTVCGILLLGFLFAWQRGEAQTVPDRTTREIDLSFAYNSLYRNTTTANQFGQQGAAVEFSSDLTRHWGAAGWVSGEHTSKVTGAGYNLTTVTGIIGPRYTIVRNRKAFYGEALFGESFGFDSFFPHRGAALNSYDSFAFQVGGGVDFRLTPRIAVRAVQASWLRTNFPNATTNVQNSLQIGAGIILRLSH